MNQKDFERLIELMVDKGVRNEAFELLADLRHEAEWAEIYRDRLEQAELDKINYKADADRLAHWMALVEDDVTDAHTLGSTRAALAAHEEGKNGTT